MKASLIMCHLNKGLKEEKRQVRHLRKDMPGSETSKCKCPEAGTFFLMLLKNNKEASVAKTRVGNRRWDRRSTRAFALWFSFRVRWKVLSREMI